MDLSIIIVNWNTAACVRQCLHSLFAHCRLDDVEIVVVDSGSFDGCDRMLAREFPGVRFVQSRENVGFARANNLGVRSALGEAFLFLNPDTVLHEDTPAQLLHCLDTLPRAGAVGCRLLNADGSVQTSALQAFPTVLNQVLDAHWLRERFPESPLWGMAPLYRRGSAPSEAAALSGACLAVTRQAFAAVGGFSECYFMYGEDLDLCRKLHDAGWKVYYTPETSLVHLGGGSSRQAPGDFSIVMMRISVHRFIRLHQGRAAAAGYRVAMGVSAILRLLLIGPARLFGDRVVRHGADSWRKWRAILGWSAGLRML